MNLEKIATELAPVHNEDTTRRPSLGWFAVHAVALLVALCALIPLVDNDEFAIPDEGLYAAQADNLAHGSWAQPRPTAAIDEEGNWFVLSGSIIVGDNAIPYARRPLYPFVLTPFWSIGGVAGSMVLSVLGTWIAACASSAIGCTFNRRTALPSLWLVGLGTPLLFDAYLAVGHSIGAAFAALAALGVLRCQQSRAPFSTQWFGWLALGGIGAAAAVMFRSEGVIYVVALGSMALLVAALRRRRPTPQRSADAVAGIGLVVIATAAYAMNYMWSSSIAQGAPGDSTISARQPDFLNAAWTGLARPWYPDNTAASAAMTLVLLTAVAAPLVYRFLPRFKVLATGLIVLGAISAAWNTVSSPRLISGLLPTVPWIVIGLLSIRRRDVARVGPVVILLSTGVFVLGVLATSYGFGGAAEWGGRFFHLAIPAIGPVAVLGLIALRAPLPHTIGRIALAAIVVTTASLSLSALRANQQLRTETRQLVDVAAQAATGVAESGARVLATTSADGTPRLLWRERSERSPLLTADGLINLAGLLNGLPPEITRVDVLTNSADSSRLDPLLQHAPRKKWSVSDHRLEPDAGLAVFTLERTD